ncbi:MAG: tellurite resistance TerB family protein [Proteobacteria bacterium]|nr:tellurite resistance TerB family protein [Pseudomonadota bacterium]
MDGSTISAHAALVQLMVMVSASDSEMSDSELKTMGGIVSHMPIFRGYDPDKLISDAETCAEILGEDEGVETVLGLLKEALPKEYGDTAYAIACDVAVADSHLSQEELRILEMIRHELGVDRLTAAAIERGAVARRRSF